MSLTHTDVRLGKAPRLLTSSFAAVAVSLALCASLSLHAATGHAFASPQTSSASVQPVKKKTTKKKRPHREPIQKAPTTDRIQEIQSALAREGYYKGDPSGKWDDETQDAMRRFQEEHDLTGTGKIDATSLQKLGLGSDIAGVSAPRPPQPSGSPSKLSVPSPTPTSPAVSAPANPSATNRQ